MSTVNVRTWHFNDEKVKRTWWKINIVIPTNDRVSFVGMARDLNVKVSLFKYLST